MAAAALDVSHQAPVAAQLGERPQRRDPWADVDRAADMAAAVPGEPRYVTACRACAWTFTWWKGGDAPKLRRAIARCRSWRHEGPCARWRAACDWSRIATAFKPYPKRECVYLVLSMARVTSPDGPHESELKRWGDVGHTWSALGPRMWRLLKRLRRWCCRDHGCERRVWSETQQRFVLRCVGECSEHQLSGRYVAVVEQHAPWGPAGERWPHLNIVVHWPWLAQLVRESPTRLIPRGGDRPDGRVLGAGPLLESIVASGWGYQSCAELVNDRKKVAGYLVKHAAATGRMAGEVAKKLQTPTAAPGGFRRVRSGRGFLEPMRRGSSDGAIVRKDEHGHWHAVSRRRKGERVWVAGGPPAFRPRVRTIWIDMEGERVYTPEWSGWSSLPFLSDDGEPWTLVVDVRGPPSGAGSIERVAALAAAFALRYPSPSQASEARG